MSKLIVKSMPMNEAIAEGLDVKIESEARLKSYTLKKSLFVTNDDGAILLNEGEYDYNQTIEVNFGGQNVSVVNADFLKMTNGMGYKNSSVKNYHGQLKGTAWDTSIKHLKTMLHDILLVVEVDAQTGRVMRHIPESLAGLDAGDFYRPLKGVKISDLLNEKSVS